MHFYTDIVRDGNYLLIRAIKNGKDNFVSLKYEPHLYVKNEFSADSEYKDWYLENSLTRVDFNDMYEFSRFIKEHKNTKGYLWGNTDPIVQYIEENFTSEYDATKIRIAFIDIEVMTRLKASDGSWIDGGFPSATKAEFPVNAICHYDNLDDTFYLFGLSDWSAKKSEFQELARKTKYFRFNTEKQLLQEYISFFKRKMPHCITGWNVEGFDIPYLSNRIISVLDERHLKKLSPWGKIESREIKTSWGYEQRYTIYGIPILDYLELYKKHTFKNRELHTLDYISKVELEDTKKAFEGTHGSFFWDNPQGFYDYNIKDVDLVRRIDKKLNLLNLVYSLAYFSGINWVSTFSPIKTWNSLIYRVCNKKKILPPIINKNNNREAYEGAYVHEPKKGMYTDIVSCDFTSLYPSIMREWNIGPDTFITDTQILEEFNNTAKCDSKFYEAYINNNIVSYTLQNHSMPDEIQNFLKKYNCSLAMNCSLYTKERESIVYSMLTELFLGRKADKKKAQEVKKRIKEENTLSKEELNILKIEFSIYDTSQLVKKIILNSLYGALGSNFFDYYNPKVAEAITYNGQFLVQDSANYVIEYLRKIKKNDKDFNYLAYGDTDSAYFDVSPLVQNMKTKEEKLAFLDKLFAHIEKKVLPVRFSEVSTCLNTYKNGSIMHMDREVLAVADKENGQEYVAFWAAKKKYAILVDNLEGVAYKEPYLKVMGLSLVQSSTPEFFRNKLSDFMRVFISKGKNSKKYVDEAYEAFKHLEIEEIAFPRSVSSVSKYIVDGEIVKGTPIQSKSAINYNTLLKKFNLSKKYQEIRDGDKIKFLFLLDNPYGFDTIAFKDKLPKEFRLHAYIDKDKHFYKAMKKPIEDMFRSCDWALEEVIDTDDLFG